MFTTLASMIRLQLWKHGNMTWPIVQLMLFIFSLLFTKFHHFSDSFECGFGPSSFNSKIIFIVYVFKPIAMFYLHSNPLVGMLTLSTWEKRFTLLNILIAHLTQLSLLPESILTQGWSKWGTFSIFRPFFSYVVKSQLLFKGCKHPPF